jgi:hypothetical protein
MTDGMGCTLVRVGWMISRAARVMVGIAAIACVDLAGILDL